MRGRRIVLAPSDRGPTACRAFRKITPGINHFEVELGVPYLLPVLDTPGAPMGQNPPDLGGLEEEK